MPVVTSYLHGSTAGVPPTVNDHQRAKRDRVRGWSAGAVRRHTRWLYSVDDEGLALDAVGYALTLTMRDCPANARVMHAMRREFVKRLQRRGLVRLHWVVEWQRRGVPHFHCAAYFDPRAADEHGLHGADMGMMALIQWVAVAADLGATFAGQHYNPIESAVGWNKYLSKHAARGAQHYQRQGHPQGWDSTGRLWGYVGEWPIVEPDRHHLTTPGFHRYRRLVQSWRIADARRALAASRTDSERRAALQRLGYARRMFKSDDRGLSSTRGVSEWTPFDVHDRILRMLADEGHIVEVQPDAE